MYCLYESSGLADQDKTPRSEVILVTSLARSQSAVSTRWISSDTPTECAILTCLRDSVHSVAVISGVLWRLVDNNRKPKAIIHFLPTPFQLVHRNMKFTYKPSRIGTVELPMWSAIGGKHTHTPSGSSGILAPSYPRMISAGQRCPVCGES